MRKSNIIEEISKSHEKRYDRGLSWEHCYLFFRNHEKFRNDKTLLDFAALHLGFFLASWGMLRGSSFLLQKDYKFYIPLVEILINSKYDKLWNIDFLDESKEQNIDLLFDLKSELEKQIKENLKADKESVEHEMNLIITKVIMATMGCIPAYDRYFKDGLKEKNINPNFNEKSFKDLLIFINKNNNLKKVYRNLCLIKGTKIKYPPMKLVDLYFWLSGQQKDEKK